MQNTAWMGKKFWLNAGLSLSVAGMPWTAAISLLGTSTMATLVATPVQAAMLSSWEFDPSTQELLVTVPEGTQPRYFLAAEPARIVLDLPDTEVGTVPLQQTYEGSIREIRIAQHAPGVTRIVLELAPGTILAPGHVELQQVENSGETDDRWVLRPLLATNATVATTSPSTPAETSPSATATVPSPDLPVSTPSETEELPPLEPGATEIPVAPPDSAAIASNSDEATVASPMSLPLPANVQGSEGSEPPNVEQSAEADQPEAGHSESVRMPSATEVQSETISLEDSPENSAAGVESAADSETTSVATLPTLPEASADALPTSPSSETVSVPPLGSEQMNTADTQTPPPPLTPTRPQASSSAATPSSSTTDSSAANFPTPSFPSPDLSDTTSGAASVEPSPLPEPIPAQPSEAVSDQPTPTPAPSAPPSIAAAATPNAPIEFGQPLPKSSSNFLPPATPGTSEGAIGYSGNNTGNILLPAGTVLNLRYPGEESLELIEGEPRQEVLVLDEAVRDEAGNEVFPAGSYVLGRFEVGENGNQFVAQAISLQGQSLALNAQSEPLSGDRNLSQGHLFRNSALGVAAGLALAVTGFGLIPAIAAGAATAAGVTFIPDSQANVVSPDQVLEVHLTQDLVRAN